MLNKNVWLLFLFLLSGGVAATHPFYTRFIVSPKHRNGVDASLRLRLGDIYFDTGKNMISRQAFRKFIDSPITIAGHPDDTLMYYETDILPQHGDLAPGIRTARRELSYAIKYTVSHNDTAYFFFSNVFVKTHADSICHRVYGFRVYMR